MAKITTVEQAMAAVREDGEALKDVPKSTPQVRKR